jgi:hypothetical protein
MEKLNEACINNMFDEKKNTPRWLINLAKFGSGIVLFVFFVILTIVLLPLFIIPLVSSIPLYTLSLAFYGKMLFISPFSLSVQSDMDKIRWNLNNSDPKIVLQSEKCSFYKGIFIKRYGNPQTSRGGGVSFGIIGIGRGERREYVPSHEYGHTKQQRLIGIILYTVIVGIPSLISSKISKPGEHEKRWYEKWATKWGVRGFFW